MFSILGFCIFSPCPLNCRNTIQLLTILQTRQVPLHGHPFTHIVPVLLPFSFLKIPLLCKTSSSVKSSLVVVRYTLLLQKHLNRFQLPFPQELLNSSLHTSISNSMPKMYLRQPHNSNSEKCVLSLLLFLTLWDLVQIQHPSFKILGQLISSQKCCYRRLSYLDLTFKNGNKILQWKICYEYDL